LVYGITKSVYFNMINTMLAFTINMLHAKK